MKRILLVLCMMLTPALTNYAGIRPGSGGHGSGHAPEMTEVAMMLAGLASVGGYLAIRSRYNRQK